MERTGKTAPHAEDRVATYWTRLVEARETGGEDLEARDALVEHYMPLVHQTAARMSRKLPDFIDVDELISAGSLGLFDAVSRFDPSRNNKFETFCRTRITGAIIDDLRNQAWQPRQALQHARRLEECRGILRAQLGRSPTIEEIATEMGLEPEEVQAMVRDDLKSMVPLDAELEERGERESTLQDVLCDPQASDPLSEIERRELKEVALRGLSENEQTILVAYYYDGLSFKEIGLALGLCESRICQIHKEMLETLRSKFAFRGILCA